MEHWAIALAIALASPGQRYLHATAGSLVGKGEERAELTGPI